MVGLSLVGEKQDLTLILTVIAAGFAVNFFVLTPNINKMRDAVWLEMHRKKEILKYFIYFLLLYLLFKFLLLSSLYLQI